MRSHSPAQKAAVDKAYFGQSIYNSYRHAGTIVGDCGEM